MANENSILNVNCKIANLSDDSAVIGGTWKFEETFKCDKVTFQDDVIESFDKSHTIVFDKYVEVNPSDVVKYFDSDADEGDLTEAFGSTKIHLWYNSQFPLIGICRYENNEIDSIDANVTGMWSIAKLGYPVFGLTSTEATTKEFTNDDLNDGSATKLGEIGNGEEVFTITWNDSAYIETTTKEWLDCVSKWVKIHNDSILDEEYKKSDDFILNIADNVTKMKFNSILHKLTQGKIDNLQDFFFTV